MARIDLQKISLFITSSEKRWFLGLFAATTASGLGSVLISYYAQSQSTETPNGSNQWPVVDHGKTYYITDFQNTILTVTVPIAAVSFLLLWGFIFFVIFPQVDKRLKEANKTLKDIC